MKPLRFSYFQLTFGQEETYLHPEVTYERLKRFGYDAIELCPPKGRYGLGVSLEQYVATHKKLTADFGLGVSCVNECWGEMWDPYSPNYKTLTEPKTAALAVSETRSSIDVAAELQAPFVTVAVAIHAGITRDNVQECSAVAVDALRQMCDYARSRQVRLVFEATNHLEMGKFVNTVLNHKRLIERTGRNNIGIQIDWFHANFEELNPYEAVMDAQPLLWHMHFRDSNSLTPGYGTDPDTAARDGIEYLRLMERIAEYQLDPDFPNGFAVA